MDSKPTMITAQEFIDNHYVTKIVLGECKVMDVFPMEAVEVECIYPVDNRLEVVYVDAPNDPCGINAKTALHVEWLPPQATPQPQPATAPTAGGAGDGDPWIKITLLEADLATLRAENAKLVSELAAARTANASLQKRLNKMSRKSELDEGFIDFLTTKDGDS